SWDTSAAGALAGDFWPNLQEGSRPFAPIGGRGLLARPWDPIRPRCPERFPGSRLPTYCLGSKTRGWAWSQLLHPSKFRMARGNPPARPTYAFPLTYQFWLAGFRKEIAVKERVSPGCRVGKIDVRQLSMTQLVDFSAVAFHPRQFSKTGLALNRDNGHVARARAVRIRPHAEQHRFSGGLFK